MSLSIAVLLAVPQTTASPIRTLAELENACRSSANVGRTFDVEGNVYSYIHRPKNHEWSFLLSDNGNHRLTIYERNEPGMPATNLSHVALNDRIRLQGVVYAYNGRTYAGYKNAVFIRSCPLATDKFDDPRDLFHADSLHRLMRFKGNVLDAFRDEGDANYVYMTISCSGQPLHVMVAHLAEFPFAPGDYIGAEVVVCGLCSGTEDCLRRHVRRMLLVSGPENIAIIRPPETDPGKIPRLGEMPPLPPAAFSTLGRHQTVGTVLATWKDDNVLVRSTGGDPIKAQLLKGPLPSCGQTIRLIGLPATDLYFISLIHASWEPTGETPTKYETPTAVTPVELLTNATGNPQIKISMHGKAIRLTGVVRHLPTTGPPQTRLLIESGECLVPVDVSTMKDLPPQLSVGSTISVSGTCVIDIDSPNIGTTIPRATGFFVVPRIREDVRILAHPPWWTPRKLLGLLGLLAVALVGVISWNVSLNRRSRARGRELAAEQLARVTTELKVNERTRLAVELHDALSQTLTGVSMQLDAAAGFDRGNPSPVSRRLALASRTIDACRMELRNTLWDLRSAALDETDVNVAIRKTLCQNLAGIDLSVRFNVPRETFSDNTAHAILKIIRELATNAIRHGKASAIRIAGALDDGHLLFSVRDNGRGFDLDAAPGAAEGHFGLQGIFERLERLNGEMKIDSAPGRGTKVTVTIPLPRSGE